MNNSELLTKLEDLAWGVAWDIDTHSDDGFQTIIYMSELTKIIEKLRKEI